MVEIKRAGTVLVLACLLSMGACGGGGKTATRDMDGGDDEAKTVNANVKKGVKPEPDAQVAVVETDFGRMVIELYPNLAPQMVERFKKLVNEGFYNGTTFHRVDPQLGIIQGGDPLSKGSDVTKLGTGDSPYPNVPAEFSDVPFDRGIVGAARRGASPGFGGQPALSEEQAWNTANSQFYITLKRVPDFDEQYTVFGKVIEGMNTADVIAGAPTAPDTERPADKITIKSITLQPRSKG